jgi:hypothetical protein
MSSAESILGEVAKLNVDDSVKVVLKAMQVLWMEQHQHHLKLQEKAALELQQANSQLDRLKSELNTQLAENNRLKSEIEAVKAGHQSDLPLTPRSAGKPPKHVMLSYQWDSQPLAKRIYEALKALDVPVWFDIAGGMAASINDSMAFGVENAAVFVCIMTSKYQQSVNCSKEYNYADACRVKIVPIKGENFTPTGSLGLIIAGLLYVAMFGDYDFNAAIKNLHNEISHHLKASTKAISAAAAKPTPEQLYPTLPWSELATAIRDASLSNVLKIFDEHPTTSEEFSIRAMSALRNHAYDQAAGAAKRAGAIAQQGGKAMFAALNAFPKSAELCKHFTKIMWELHHYSQLTYNVLTSLYKFEDVMISVLNNHRNDVDVVANIFGTWGLAPKVECEVLLGKFPGIFKVVHEVLDKYQKVIAKGEKELAHEALLVIAAISVLAQFEYYKVGQVGDLGDYAVYIVNHLMTYYVDFREVMVVSLECLLVFVTPYIKKLGSLGPKLVNTILKIIEKFPDDNQLIRQCVSCVVNFCGHKAVGAPQAVLTGLEKFISVFKVWKTRYDANNAVGWRPNVHRILQKLTADNMDGEVVEAVQQVMGKCGVSMSFMESCQ